MSNPLVQIGLIAILLGMVIYGLHIFSSHVTE